MIPLSDIHGEPSFTLATPELDLAVTRRGGHMAPVTFHLSGRDVSPYALAPWLPGEFPNQPCLLSVLRGDFFCLPFGPQNDGPPHGDPANAVWTHLSQSERTLALRLDAVDSGATVEKILEVRPGHHAIYATHRISNLDGDFSYGTHPILDLSELPAGAARVSVSPFRWASVFPGVFSDPSHGESQALQPGAHFRDLREVPLASGGCADLTRYPARPGNDDLVMMVSEPSTAAQPFAWSAVVIDGFLWFAIKDPAAFPSTLFWMSNNGRQAAPWNGRHAGRLGIEEVCSFFSHGVTESRRNPLADSGIPTVRRFTPGTAVALKVVHAVGLVPDGFGLITAIVPAGPDAVAVIDETGTKIEVACTWGFVL